MVGVVDVKRQVFRDVKVQIEHRRFHEFHAPHGGDAFGNGGNAVARRFINRPVVLVIPESTVIRLPDFPIANDKGRHAHHAMRFHGFVHGLGKGLRRAAVEQDGSNEKKACFHEARD